MQVVTLKKFGGGLIYSSNFDGVGATAKLGKKVTLMVHMVI